MGQLDTIRKYTFWGLFAVSAFLSITLYINIVDAIFDKIIMFVVAISIEGLKVLALTWANTSLWQALQLRTKYPRDAFKRKSDFTSPTLHRDRILIRKKQRKARALFAVYAVTACISISASFGYILQTVDHATASSETVSTDSQKSVLAKQLALKERAIAQNDKSITQYNKMIDLLDPTSKTYTKDFETYNKKIASLTDANTLLLNEEKSINEQMVALDQSDITTTQTVPKTMYQLMGAVLGIPDKTIMFVLLAMISLLIELGIFVCSPHLHDTKDEDIAESPDNPPPTSGDPQGPTMDKAQVEDIVRSVLGAPGKIGYEPTGYGKIENDEEGHKELTSADMVKVLKEVKSNTLRSSTPFADTPENTPSPEELGEVVRSALIKPLQSNVQDTPAVEPLLGDGDVEVLNAEAAIDAIVEEAKKQEPATEVVEVEEAPVRQPRPKLEIEKYIEALFDNEGKVYLKDKVKACDEMGIPRANAAKYWQWLSTTKVNKYPIIEYRQGPNKWFPNVTSEVAKSIAYSEFSREKGS